MAPSLSMGLQTWVIKLEKQAAGWRGWGWGWGYLFLKFFLSSQVSTKLPVLLRFQAKISFAPENRGVAGTPGVKYTKTSLPTGTGDRAHLDPPRSRRVRLSAQLETIKLSLFKGVLVIQGPLDEPAK